MEKPDKDKQPQRLKLQSNGIVRFTKLSEIIYMKADDNYTLLILDDNSKFIVCKSLVNFEIVFGFRFFRCHKSYLVNPIHVREINIRTHEILMSSGERIPVPKSKVKILEGLIQDKNVEKLQTNIRPHKEKSVASKRSFINEDEVFIDKLRRIK